MPEIIICFTYSILFIYWFLLFNVIFIINFISFERSSVVYLLVFII